MDKDSISEEEVLARGIKLLEWFGKNLSKDTIYIHSGDNSVLCNPNIEPKEWNIFLGHSIYSIAEFVAKKLNKKIVYDD